MRSTEMVKEFTASRARLLPAFNLDPLNYNPLRRLIDRDHRDGSR